MVTPAFYRRRGLALATRGRFRVAGVEILPTILLGVAFVLHTALVPCLVLGVAMGLIVVLTNKKSATHVCSASQTNHAS